MKESILGLATIAILFGVVWLSQGEVYTSKYQSQTNYEMSEKLDSDQIENINKSDLEIPVKINKEINETVDPCGICKNIYEVDTKIKNDMQYTNMYDNFTFSEAFKLCRQCQGNDGIFYWKDNLYLTEIKENNEKITKEELIDLKPLQK